jgi:hypothetical protein
MRIHLLLSALLAGSSLLSPAQTHFTRVWSGNGLNHMNFNVTSATINGVSCQTGDEIGVFDGNSCVGVGMVSSPGAILFITASADDPLTPGITDGFISGDTVILKIWDASQGIEITTLQANIISGQMKFSEGGSTWLSLSAQTLCVPPDAPLVGTITQPTCTIATASVALSGLPATGTWTLTRTPGGNTYNGTGTTYTVSGLPANATYNFTVTNADGCVSGASGNAAVNAQPAAPTAPVVGTITQPTCAVATASVALSGLPATDTWTLTRTPGGNTYNGTGTTYTVTGLPANATYNFTVTNADGCVSGASGNAAVNAQPAAPTAPVVGTITQPTCAVATASVALSGLPATGTWTLTRTPGGNTDNGTGTTYTVTGLPANATYTFTVTNADGCVSGSSGNVAVNALPSAPTAPVVGTITQPTCAVATASVALSGLPATGTWTLTRTPGGNTYNGTGTTYTVNGLPANATYTFTVTNAGGCVSGSSGNAVVNAQPAGPSAPVIGTITQPTCAVATASVALSGLPASGSWTLTRTPGGNTYTRTGTTYTVTGLAGGTTYTFTVTNAGGCVSGSSANVVVNAQPSTPTAPVIGTITQPTCAVSTASVDLGGLPATDTWTLTRTPGGTTYSGTGSSYTITGLAAGTTYTFTVTNAGGCISGSSGNALVNAQPASPSAPVIGTITQPTCTVATASVALSGLPATGTWTLTRTPGGTTYTRTGTTYTVTGLAAGTTYAFTVTNAAGCVSGSSGNAVVNAQPATPTAPVIGTITQPTCAQATAGVALSGLPSSGSWILTRTPGGTTYNGTGTTYTVTGLAAGTTYTFTVTNAVGCVSGSSENAVVNAQPAAPSAPVVGTVTQPTCAVATASVVLSGLPATGSWTLTRTPGGNTYIGSGTTYTVTGLAAGNSYTFAVTNASMCTSDASAGVNINSQSATPVTPSLGNITQPTCAVSTGSVVLTSLPSQGTWTLTRMPGGNTNTGSGPSTTVSGLNPGTYTFTVTNAGGCTSAASSGAVIQSQPIPGVPTVGTITQPTCALATGSVSLTGLPASGSWIVTRSPGGVTTTGSGTLLSVQNLVSGTYTFTVTNASGCTSASSSGVVIANQPVPSSPVPGKVTQPSCQVTSGSVSLSGLPASGAWILTLLPGGNTINGNGTNYTVTGLATGTYTFTVTNASGCVSSASSQIVINNLPDKPTPPLIGSVTQPSCTVGTGIVVLGGLPETGSWTLTRSPGNTTYTGSGTSYVVNGLSASTTYTFTVTNASGCRSDVSAGAVITKQPMVPNAPLVGIITDPNCSSVTGSVYLYGLPTGDWTLSKYPGGSSMPGSGTSFMFNDLLPGSYTFTVTISGGCTSAVTTTVKINDPPPGPSAPVIGTVTQPSCQVMTGSVRLTGLPSGNWTLRRYPGEILLNGSGSSITISGLNPGSHNFTVSDAAGCTSPVSAVAVINEQPATPLPPVAANVSQPTCGLSTGSITFSNLPASGSWTLVASPGGVIGTGKGSSATVSDLASGTYTFNVTNAGGCMSGPSASVTIFPQPSTPDAPLIGTITYPTAATNGSLVLRGLPKTESWLLTRNPGGFLTAGNGDTTVVKNLTAGTYYFSVTVDLGCTSQETMVDLYLINGVPDRAGEKILVFPNPVNTLLTVQMNHPGKEPATVDLLTPEGTLIQSDVVVMQDGRFELPVDTLPPGIYLIRLRFRETAHLLRFIKE